MRHIRLATLLFAAVCIGPLVAPPSAHAADAELKAAVEQFEKNARDPFEQSGRESAIRKIGKIGGRDAAAALVAVFDDPFLHLRDHAITAWITMLKGDAADETRAWLLKKGIAARADAVRSGAARALAVGGGEAALAGLAARLAKERDGPVLVDLANAWVRCGGRDPVLAAKLAAHKDGRVALALVDALGWADAVGDVFPAEAAAKLLAHRDGFGRAAGVIALQATGSLQDAQLVKILDDEAEAPRIVLAETAGRGQGDPTGVLPRLLEDQSWRVRATALEAFLWRWDPALVHAVIDRVEREDGRLKLDAHDALVTFTGKDLGLDAELWRSWWGANAEDFDPGDRPQTDGAPPRRGAGEAPGAAAEGEGRTAAFFSLPVLSTRLAFLLDCSGSMRNPAVGAAEEEGLSKMALARREVGNTLAQLPKDARFDVLLYRYPSTFPPSPEMTRALDKLVPCTPANARKANTWLAREEAKGWGAFYDALVELSLDDDVDTIYFLSDGRPSRGLYDRDFRLLDEFRRANRFRRVVIHTVLVGTKGADREFLRDLATQTGGRFSDATKDL